ncbi:helix-turn-helix domain-containing protein [Pseudomonas aeruginosa]|uniref:helix-turn-helix domain-containing protein n=1 Tax=Pseudomonas aeruginosa TaxID=287 RepID=UPI000F7F609E|nr:helix-turn-helix transcriptional regulator [Pseudomonas aeruginosa]RTB44125.1 XRE family transcriptional regulator [Pseudomonas aeruginosa]
MDSGIGQRVAEERSRLGLSQDEAAKLCGVSRISWGKYERGQSNGMTITSLRAFTEAGANVFYILTGSQQRAETGDEDEIQALHHLRLLPADTRKALLFLLQTMATQGTR